MSYLKRGCSVVEGDYVRVCDLPLGVCQIDVQDSVEGGCHSVQLTAANVRGLRDDLADWLEQHKGAI